MSKKARRRIIALSWVLILPLLPSSGYSQTRDQNPAFRYQQKPPSDDAVSRQRKWQAGLQERDAILKKEALVRRAYLLLMRYHRASNVEKAAQERSEHRPEADVQFELRNFHTGPVEDILDQPISDLISLPRRDYLAILPEYYHHNDDPNHVTYKIYWQNEIPPPPAPGDDLQAASGRLSDQKPEPADAKVETTAREFLANTPDFSTVELYTSYEVTLKLAGRERNYRAMALHYIGPASPDGATIRFVDWIAGPPPLSRALIEFLPPVRSPWSSYVNSPTYRAVVRAVRKAEEQHHKSIPTGAPLDYLPGDDAVPEARDQKEAKASMSTSAVCQAPYYTITVSPGSVSPTGMNLPTTTATVTVQTYPALSNFHVTLYLAEVVGAGGHINHSGTRPLGALAATQGLTDFTTGRFDTTYTSSIFGGDIAIFAHVAELPDVDKGVSEHVGVSLGLLGAGTNYNLVGATGTHPINHYGTATALTNLPLIANDYKAQFYPDDPNGNGGSTPIPDADKLRYNDMSVVNGGKFEIHGAWDPNDDHVEHKLGINCDVSYANVLSTRHAAVEAIFTLRHSPNFFKHPPTNPHWHLRFQ